MTLYDENDDIEELIQRINKELKKRPNEAVGSISINEPGKIIRYSKNPSKEREKRRSVWIVEDEAFKGIRE